MIEPAVIQGSLVDVRNYATDKCVKLTIHVPAERAMEVVEAFGWPTNVDPVLVAVAGLQPLPITNETAAPTNHHLSKQAALLCTAPLFWRFLEQRSGNRLIVDSASGAAVAVRRMCGVESRSEFDRDDKAAECWKQLHGEFKAWETL